MVVAAPVLASISAASSAAGAGSFLSTLGNVGSFLGSFGGLFGGSKGPKQPSFNDQVNVQKQFAQHGLRWRVEDAERAGVHPLYALGAQVAPYAPVSVGGDYEPSGFQRVSEMGQNLGSAISRMSTKEERAYGAITAAQSVERGHLENELLRSQIAQIRAASTPGISLNNRGELIPGQGNSKSIVVNPSETISTSKTNRGVEAAAPPANTIFVGYDGMPIVSPNQQLSESMEGNWPVGMVQNLVHNTVPFYYDMTKRNIKKIYKHYTQRR